MGICFIFIATVLNSTADGVTTRNISVHLLVIKNKVISQNQDRIFSSDITRDISDLRNIFFLFNFVYFLNHKKCNGSREVLFTDNPSPLNQKTKAITKTKPNPNLDPSRNLR